MRLFLIALSFICVTAQAAEPPQDRFSIPIPEDQWSGKEYWDGDKGAPENEEIAQLDRLYGFFQKRSIDHPLLMNLAQLGLAQTLDLDQRFFEKLDDSNSNLKAYANKSANLSSLFPPRPKTILVLGEGYCGLVAYLRARGINAWGLDIAYPETPSGKEPLEKPAKTANADRFSLTLDSLEIAVPTQETLFVRGMEYGDATKIGENDHFSQPDMILAHALLNNLKREQQIATLRGAYKKLKPGGQMRMSAISPKRAAQELIDEALPEEVIGKSDWYIFQVGSDELFILNKEK